jgi:CRP-like cAMP-binding protein
MQQYRMSDLISAQLSLSDEEANIINDYIPVVEFKKGTILLREGQVALDSYFTLHGCVRQYYSIDGEEKTVAFFTEGESISSLSSYLHSTPANHFLECVEDCVLAVLNIDKERELYKLVRGFESLCRASVEDDFAKQQQQMAAFIIKSPEERYLDLLENRSNLLQRVPQYHLASYLGVKPESLSRIRKRIADRNA